MRIKFDLLILLTIIKISESWKCGESGIVRRVVGGYVAPPHLFPWMALLELNFMGKDGYASSDRCGGSIISPQYILTAAHCFDADDGAEFLGVKIVLGEHDTKTSDGQEVYAKSVHHIIHENYDNSLFKNDIALIRMNVTLDFEGAHQHIMPICLPNISHSTVEKTHCQIAGWGHTKNAGQSSSVLMTAPLPILTDEYCTKVWGQDEYFPKNHVCAGYPSGQRDSCQGDSGGPLTCRKDSRTWVQYGLVSFGGECGEKEKPGVYTRIYEYIDWIKTNSGAQSHSRKGKTRKTKKRTGKGAKKRTVKKSKTNARSPKNKSKPNKSRNAKSRKTNNKMKRKNTDNQINKNFGNKYTDKRDE